MIFILQEETLNVAKMYSEFKFWSVVIGAFLTTHQGLKWLEGLKTSINKIDEKLTSQTSSIVKEISEMRNDLRALTRPVVNVKST